MGELGGQPSLYGTYLVPGGETFPLGYVGLKTGKAVPLIAGRLGPDLPRAEDYLRLLWERWPRNRS